MDPSTNIAQVQEPQEPNVAEATEPSRLEATESPAAPAMDASTEPEPKAAIDNLAKATEDPSPFGTLKRRTTEAWNNLPKPALPSELPPFPSIAADLPTQESARETFGTLKRRTTESFETFSRQTTEMANGIAKRADFSGLTSMLPKMPWGQGAPQDAILEATWERILVPSLPRSSHSVNVVGGNAYVFGGEIEPRKPVDNDMHLIRLPYSSADADYFAIKPKAAPRTQVGQIPTVVEPVAGDEGKKAGQALPDRSSLGDVPSARVGHATAVIGTRIFLFGGRGGPDMGALEEFGRVWVFDTKTNMWSYIDPVLPTTESDSAAFADKRQHYPAARSYHSAVGVSLPRDFSSKGVDKPQTWAQWAQGDSDTRGTPQNPIVGSVASNSRDEDEDGYGTFIIHGGCFTQGRANDVWAFDVRSKVWQELPSAPGKPRGGTSLALAGGKLWRFGGFNGEGEEGGQLDHLELGIDSFNDRSGKADVLLSAKGEWKSILAEEPTSAGQDDATKPLTTAGSHPWPGNRSVAGLETVTIGGPSGREYLLLTLGERDPSDDGHNAAGKFWDDVWAYEMPRPSWLGGASAAAAEGKWFKVKTGAYDDEDVGAAKGPGPRGWFASAKMGELDERGIVLWGGVDAQNSRLGDGWILRLGSEKREA